MRMKTWNVQEIYEEGTINNLVVEENKNWI